MRNKIREKLTKRTYLIASFVLVFVFIGGYKTLSDSRAATVSGIIADINGDKVVNILDLSKLLSNFTKSLTEYGQGDLNNSGKIDIYDLSILLAHYGKVELEPDSTMLDGKVNFVLRNTGETDAFVGDGSPATQAWINQHYWRMEVFANYFWDKTIWYKNGWNYKDATSSGGVYTVIDKHQDWILRDGNNNKLYIPWGCEDGLCDSYAVDIGNPNFRQEWINQAKAEIAGGGYKGLWVDDINMDWRVSDSKGNSILPIDPRTGTTMTIDNWRRYLAEFTEQIRQQMPNIEILHNNIWYAGKVDGSKLGANDPYITRQIKAADYINREAGFNDGGLTSGSGTYSYNALLNYIDYVHSLGKNVVIDSFTNNLNDREYGLASYLLINNGNDGYGNNDASYPNNWWSGYDINLGNSTNERYIWNGMWRRDFQNGTILTNPPGSPIRSGDIGSNFTKTNGQSLRNVTLNASQGLILRKP